jgi:hypothetical protein
MVGRLRDGGPICLESVRFGRADASFTLTSRRSLLATRADAVASRDAQEGPLAGLAYPFTASRV